MANIEKALGSPKVDPYMLAVFEQEREAIDFDPKVKQVAFLARVRSTEVKLEGTLSIVGTIYAMLTTYSVIPGIVENPDVFQLDASRPSGSIE